jgi:LPXTG-site transpeptidase (sortase) family protein
MKGSTPTKTISRSSATKTRRRTVRKNNIKITSVSQEKHFWQKKTFKLLSRITLGLSIIFFIVFFNMLLMRMFPVAKQKTLGAATTKIPIEITITAVGIDLPIIPAEFANGTFQTTTQGASYLTSSPIPGTKGNSIIYAHNWWNLFASLPKVKSGEKITILFSNKTKQVFTIIKTQTVSAYATSILQPTENNQLTLFTCANFLDADRFVVIATAD